MLSSLRMLRLLRLVRLVRLVKELALLCHGFLDSLATLAWALALIGLNPACFLLFQCVL